MRRLIRAALAATLSIALAQAPSPVAAAPCWRPPVTGEIVDHFRSPACPYCSGNRGIEYRIDGITSVLAVAAGRVTFSGPVAGTHYVVVEHADQWKVTYGRLSEVNVQRGDAVVRGALLGVAHRNFYFGLRVNNEYRDPEPFLGQQVGRARLVPVDGSPRRPVSSPVWECRQ